MGVVLGWGVAWAGPGTAELSLDRRAVADLIAAALPPARAFDVPGLGELTLAVGPPRDVRFVDGGIEATVDLHAERLDWSAPVDVRYVPGVERPSGTVQLVPQSVVPRLALPFEVDLARWIGPVDLPRRLDWELALEGRGRIELVCFVQGLRIDDSRLRIELGLLSRQR